MLTSIVGKKLKIFSSKKSTYQVICLDQRLMQITSGKVWRMETVSNITFLLKTYKDSMVSPLRHRELETLS